MAGAIALMLAVQPGQRFSQSGPYITCCTTSCRLSPNSPASVTGPSGPWNTYSWSIRTMGSLRRSAFSVSRARVNFFSCASSCRLASSHSSRDTTSGRLITKPPVNGDAGFDLRHRYDEPPGRK